MKCLNIILLITLLSLVTPSWAFEIPRSTYHQYIQRLQDSIWLLKNLRSEDLNKPVSENLLHHPKFAYKYFTLYPNEKYKDFLFALLDHKSFVLRRIAVESLDAFNGEDIFQALIHALKDKNEAVRREAVRILAQKRDREVIPLLIEALSDESPDVRTCSAAFLSFFDDAKVVEALIRGLEDDPSVLGNLAIFSLTNIKDRRAITPILKHLWPLWMQSKDYPHDTSLVNFGSLAIPDLLFALHDKSCLVRRKAAYLLGKIGNPGTIEALNKACEDSDIVVRIRALQSIHSINKNVSMNLFNKIIELAWYQQQNRNYQASTDLLKHAIKFGGAKFGSNNIMLIKPLLRLASIYFHTSQFALAEDTDRKALSIYHHNAVKDYYWGTLIYYALANDYITQKKYVEAEQALQEAIIILEEKLSKEYYILRRAMIYNTIATLYCFTDRYSAAEFYMKEAINILLRLPELDKIKIDEYRLELACIEIKKGDFLAAKEILSDITRRISKSTLDIGQIITSYCWYLHGYFHLKQGNYKEAEEYSLKALQEQESFYSANHLKVANTCNQLSKIYKAKGAIEKANSYTEREALIKEKLELDF